MCLKSIDNKSPDLLRSLISEPHLISETEGEYRDSCVAFPKLVDAVRARIKSLTNGDASVVGNVAAEKEEIWSYNGSTIKLVSVGNTRAAYLNAPGTVGVVGEIVFEGVQRGTSLVGRGFSRKAGCLTASFDVSGRIEQHQIVLRGNRPNQQAGCSQLKSTDPVNLVFTYVGPLGADRTAKSSNQDFDKALASMGPDGKCSGKSGTGEGLSKDCKLLVDQGIANHDDGVPRYVDGALSDGVPISLKCSESNDGVFELIIRARAVGGRLARTRARPKWRTRNRQGGWRSICPNPRIECHRRSP